MASIRKIETATGYTYAVQYRDKRNRATTKRGFATRREAEAFKTSLEHSLLTGAFVDPKAGRATFESVGTPWLAAHAAHVRPSTYRADESAWRMHVMPKWGHVRLDAIRHSDVQSWVADMHLAGRSLTIIKRSHGLLAGVLKSAVRDRRIFDNPAESIRFPKKQPAKRNFLTREQVDLLAKSSKYPGLVYVLATTGLRWGEAAALRVRSWDRAASRLKVVENAVLVGWTIEIGPPKNNHARTVPVPRFMEPYLIMASRGKAPESFLFGDGDSPLKHTNSVKGWFAGAVKRAQAADPTFPRVTRHDLRHTAASLAVSSGANVKAVQRMLGHSSAAMTLDVYADLFENDLDQVSAGMDKLWEA